MVIIVVSIGIAFVYSYYSGYYYKSVFKADKVKITDMDTGENVIYVLDDYKRKNIISSFSNFPRNKLSIIIQYTQKYKVEFLKKDKVKLTTFVGKVESYDNNGNVNFQPTNSGLRNTLLYEHEGQEYIFYTRKYYISWSENFNKLILDKISSM